MQKTLLIRLIMCERINFSPFLFPSHWKAFVIDFEDDQFG